MVVVVVVYNHLEHHLGMIQNLEGVYTQNPASPFLSNSLVQTRIETVNCGPGRLPVLCF